jgi:hypothetical protein
VYKILVRKPEGKRPLWRPRHRWEDNLEVGFKQGGCYDVSWIRVV